MHIDESKEEQEAKALKAFKDFFKNIKFGSLKVTKQNDKIVSIEKLEVLKTSEIK